MDDSSRKNFKTISKSRTYSPFEKYAGEVIIGESQKIGFQPVKYQQNSDGSNTLVLERWNSEKN